MDVDPTYEFIKAPQYYDFNNPESSEMENPEHYFDFDHEAGVPVNELLKEEPESDTAAAPSSECSKYYDLDDPSSQTIIQEDEQEKTLVNATAVETAVEEKAVVDNVIEYEPDGAEQNVNRMTFEGSQKMDETRQVESLCSSMDDIHLKSLDMNHEQFLTELKARTTSAINLVSGLSSELPVESTPALRRRSKSFSSVVRPTPAKGLTLPETPEVLRRNFSKFAATKAKIDGQGSSRLMPAMKLQHGPIKPVSAHVPHVREGGTFGEMESDFADTLRSYNPNNKGSQNNLSRTTNPAPFHFHETKKKPEEQQENKPFVSLAEQVMFFQKGTPKRFRGSKNEHCHGSTDDIGIHYRLTQAVTPNLTAVHRHRPVTALSREEQEMKELEEAQKHKFKANPLNEKILRAENVKVPRPPSKEVTVPEPFHLTEVQHKPKMPVEERPEFHARPVPKSVLQGPLIPPKRDYTLTVAQSPAFASKHLPRRTRNSESEEDHPSNSRSNMTRSKSMDRNLHKRFGSTGSIGSTGSRSSAFSEASCIPTKRKPTNIEPFAVEERSKQMLAKKEEKIKKVLEEEKKAREFHAQPLPRLDKVVGLPEKPTILPTVQKPFNLVGDERAEKYREKIAQKLEEEEKRLQEEATFHARPATVLQKEGFKPEPARKPLTEIKPFKLHLDDRSKKREGFDLWIKQKEAQLEAVKRQNEQHKEEADREEIARLRKELVTKANPVPQYKPFVPEPSNKPLTTAKSPNFSVKTKKDKENA